MGLLILWKKLLLIKRKKEEKNLKIKVKEEEGRFELGSNDIMRFKKKINEERKRLIGDINRKLIEDLKKTRKGGKN